MKRVMAAAGLMAMVAGSAQATCWTRDEASAANVRQLQSMLMVTALRCQAAGTGMMGDYNAFVVSNRGTIAAGNERLRNHFIHSLGAIEGQRAYDSYTTSMANGYGAGGEGAPQSCAEAAALAQEAGNIAGAADGLLLLADRLGIEARMPEGRCEAHPAVVMANAVTPRAPAYAQPAVYVSVPVRDGYAAAPDRLAYEPTAYRPVARPAPAPVEYADNDIPPAAVMPPPPADDDPR